MALTLPRCGSMPWGSSCQTSTGGPPRKRPSLLPVLLLLPPRARRRAWRSILRSQRPAEVRLTLDQPVARERLEIESLRARKGSAKIDGATITIPSDALGAIKVTVRVPNEVPPGRYTGAILDKTTNNPRGRLTIVVGK